MNIGYLDIAIIVVLLLGLVRGATIGLVKQTTNLVGLVLTVVGAVVLLGAPGEADVDEAAHASSDARIRLGVGPGSATLSGNF